MGKVKEFEVEGVISNLLTTPPASSNKKERVFLKL